MPRLNIIVLNRPDDSNPNLYRLALWADVPATRQSFYAVNTFVSAWKDATGTDNTNLKNGAVLETVVELTVPSGWTLAQVQSEAESRWQKYQTFVTNRNPWVRYGTTWDGTTWVNGGAS